ncbi:MAG: epoxyqueuosine reductase QueH [Alphaproteobacteria bacterium]|nr:epoxyqueuosine reductase QueH [Alphaproteobacteria bacterium]
MDLNKLHFKNFLPQLKEEGILLHTCCAPCAVEAVERLKENNIQTNLYFYNPNIFDKEEYLKRLGEVKRLATFYNLDLVEDIYDPESFLCQSKGLEQEPERGKRCFNCFKMRLEKLRAYAQDNKFRYTTSVLGVSRWKDFDQTVHASVVAFLGSTGTEYLPINWRKGGSELRRQDLIKEQKIYTQSFCGCPFSKKITEI